MNGLNLVEIKFSNLISTKLRWVDGLNLVGLS